MTKRARKTPAATLPPFPWVTSGGDGLGGTAPLARPRLVLAGIDEGADVSGGEVQDRPKTRVWKAGHSPILDAMTSDRRTALIQFAAAYERIHSPGGAGDLSSGGGGGGSNKTAGPAHAMLTAADHMRRMYAALEGCEMRVTYQPRAARRPSTHCATYRQLAQWVAVDNLSRAEVLRRIGVPKEVRSVESAFSAAMADIGLRLAVCCGLTPDALGVGDPRN